MPNINIGDSDYPKQILKTRHFTKLSLINNWTLSQSMPIYGSAQKKVPDIIDFEVIKDIGKTYFSIKASLTSKLSSDHSFIIINVNNKVIKKMQLCMLYNKKQIGIFSANK
jgi:hypothetical protein